MLKLIEQFKEKVDEVVGLKTYIISEKKNLKIKKDGLTIGQYIERINNITNLKNKLKEKIDNLNGLPIFSLIKKIEIPDLDFTKLFNFSELNDEKFNLIIGYHSSHSAILKLFNKMLNNEVQQNYLFSKYFSRSYWEMKGDSYDMDKVSFLVYSIDVIDKKDITQEELIQMIKDKKCIYMDYNNNLYDKNDKKIINILTPYNFKIDMLSEKQSVYEKLYPNLRQTIWELVNKDFVNCLKNKLKDWKKYIIAAEKNQKVLEQIISGNSNDITEYSNEKDGEKDDENEYKESKDYINFL